MKMETVEALPQNMSVRRGPNPAEDCVFALAAIQRGETARIVYDTPDELRPAASRLHQYLSRHSRARYSVVCDTKALTIYVTPRKAAP